MPRAPAMHEVRKSLHTQCFSIFQWSCIRETVEVNIHCEENASRNFHLMGCFFQKLLPMNGLFSFSKEIEKHHSKDYCTKLPSMKKFKIMYIKMVDSIVRIQTYDKSVTSQSQKRIEKEKEDM